MTPPDPTPLVVITASELRRLPRDQQEAILEAAAARAVDDYLNDPELTAFEAFGPNDLFVDSSDTEPR